MNASAINTTVRLERHGPVATLELNRPAALNALDGDMAEALRNAVVALAVDDDVRAVVVRGAGGNFMAGGDIRYFHRALDMSPHNRRGHVRDLIALIHEAVSGLRSMPKPVVASIEGACAGFGVSLMAACDLAIAAHDARFSLAYIRLGVSPDGGSTWALPRMIGMKRAMAQVMLGDLFDGAAALDMGLVNRSVPAADLAAETAVLAARLAAGPRAALGRAKALVQASLDRDLAAQLDAEADAFAEAVGGPEFEEGVRAFVAKRPPAFD